MNPRSPKKLSRKHSVSPKPKRAGRRVAQFLNMKGRMIDEIELSTSADRHSISVRFEDKTELCLVLETGFTVSAEHVDWKSGNSRVLKRWPEIRSER